MLKHNQQQLRDVTLVIASIHSGDDELSSHAVSNIVRMDLDANREQLDKFIAHIVSFEGVVHHDVVKS